MLTRSGLENKAANTERPRFRFQLGDEQASESSSPLRRRHVHPFQFSGLSVQQPHGAASDRDVSAIHHQKCSASPGGVFRIEREVIRSRLRVDGGQLPIERRNQPLTDIVCQAGVNDANSVRRVLSQNEPHE